MDDLFTQLENRLIALTQHCEMLQKNNRELIQRQILLLRERDTLLAKQKITVNQIEGMVSRLKAIEGAA